MRRLFAGVLLTLLAASLASAQTPVPPGLAPGESYRLVFTTASTHGITTDTFVPPFDFPNFGGLNSADWVITNAASAGVRATFEIAMVVLDA